MESNNIIVNTAQIPSSIKCAIFDLDGTLINSTGVWHKIDEEFLSRRGISVPADFTDEIKKHNFDTGAVYTKKRFGLYESIDEIKKEWFDLAIHEYTCNIELKKGAAEFLKLLKKNNIKLALATASDHKLYEKCLKRNGVYDCFDIFTHTTEVKRGKGYPDIYDMAAMKCGCMPQDCVVFEDILDGVKGAKNGGYYTIAVYDKASEKNESEIRRISDMYIYNYQDVIVL